jgi:hypothetical protein
MRTVFLDFDGVVNHRGTSKKYKINGVRGIDPRNVRTLNLLMKQATEKFGETPSIVISSSWRYGYTAAELGVLLNEAGFEYSKSIIGITGSHPTEIRGYEIQAWLESHGPTEGIAILDDNTDMMHFRNRLVQTSDTTGLCVNHIRVALEFLAMPIAGRKQ